jgi:peptidoglycan/LPS O-acetylase OafA/YrhL
VSSGKFIPNRPLAGSDAPSEHGGTAPVPHRRDSRADNGNLDLLRSVAVLLVVVFHVAVVWRGDRLPLRPLNLSMLGHWGVLIFFVHTSYVLMLSLERQSRDSADTRLFAEFMTRRSFRLLPLSTFTVLAVTALALPVADLPFRLAAHRAVAVPADLLLVQNITKSDSVVVTLWTLPYEMQMYLTLPALFLFCCRRQTALPLLLVWFACVCMAVIWMPRLGAFYDMPLYVPCFVSGVVGYKFACNQPATLPFILWPIALAMVSFLYLGHASVSFSWACCLILGLLIPLFRELPDGVLRNVVRLIARYSYGIYLSHFICVWLAFVAFAKTEWQLQWLILIVSLFALPIAMYHGIEAPMISAGVRLVARRRVVRDMRRTGFSLPV